MSITRDKSKSVIGIRSVLPPYINQRILEHDQKEKSKLEQLIINYKKSIQTLTESGDNIELLQQTQLHLAQAETELKKIQINIDNLKASIGMKRKTYNSAYLTKSFNPDTAFSEQQNSVRQFSHMIKMFFLQYGMNIDHCDCYEHLIAYTIQNSRNRADIVSRYFVLILPTVLTQLIFDYLNIDLYEKYVTEIDDLIPKTRSRFGNEMGDETVMTFSLPLNKKQGELIADYFNHIIEGSAKVIEAKSQENSQRNDDEEKERKESIEINVNVQTLNHPALISDLDNTLKTLPSSILDGFRKESKTISLSTAECLQKLNNAKTIIQEKKIVTELPSKIDAFTQHVSRHGLEQEEYKLIREPLIKEMNSLKEHLSEPPQKKQKWWIFSWFSPQNSEMNKPTLEKEIDDALTGIDIISNKRWVIRQ